MKQTLYLCRPLLNAGALARYADAIGLRNVYLPVDMHVTLAYSTDKVDWTKPEFVPRADTLIAEGGARRITRFGEHIVLEFEHQPISRRWSEMILAGASWDYPDYRPHVTLASDERFKIENIIAPTIPLRFGPERRAEIKQDWEARLA